MIRITHPRPQAGRVSWLGVEFIDGVAEVAELHPDRAEALALHGARIEVEGTRLEDLSVRELRDIADVEGIDLPAKAKKADIIAAIEAADGIPILSDADLVAESRREFMGAHVVPLEPGED